MAHGWSWQAPSDTSAHYAIGDLDAAMNASRIQLPTVEAGAHDETVGGLYAQKRAPEFAVQKVVIVCHKMINVRSGPDI